MVVPLELGRVASDSKPSSTLKVEEVLEALVVAHFAPLLQRDSKHCSLLDLVDYSSAEHFVQQKSCSPHFDSVAAEAEVEVD